MLTPEMRPDGRTEAWAQGFHYPEVSGGRGYSVSSWAVRDISTGKWRYCTKVSKQPDRRSWEATVRAVHGIVESIPHGASVVIYVPNEAMVKMLENGFKRTNGERGAGVEYALDLYAEISRKELRVRFEARAKGDVVKRLRDEARVAVAKRRDESDR